MKHAKKHVKRFASLLLALVMVLSMSLSAFASSAGTDPGVPDAEGAVVTGKIAINNASVNMEYSIYQILKQEITTTTNTDDNTTTITYGGYKVNDVWNDFLNSTDIKGTYFNIDGDGYVTAVESADYAEFAKLAMEYAQTDPTGKKKGDEGYAPRIAATSSQVAAGTTVEFAPLDLGYYLACGSSSVLQQVTKDDPNAEITLQGKIIIKNAIPRETYKAYRILELESYSVTKNAADKLVTNYSYKPTAEWQDFINGTGEWSKYNEFTDSAGLKQKFLSMDGDYVKWNDSGDASLFAKQALAYVEAKSLTTPYNATAGETATNTKDGTTTVEIENLPLGYYLVDTSLGALCSLDTTDSTVIMREKNQVPKNNKQVKEDSDRQWKGTAATDGTTSTEGTGTTEEAEAAGKAAAVEGQNDADIGQKVEFRSTITVYEGTDNLIFHDQMSDGLTFTQADADAITVTFKYEGGEEKPLEKSKYTVEYAEGGVSHASPDIDGLCTFHVKFDDSVVDNFTSAGTCFVTISYTATLNEHANIGAVGNENTSRVSYGDNFHATPPSTTRTRTYGFDVFKYDKADGDGLSDTKFELHANNEGKVGAVIELVKTADNVPDSGKDVYRVAQKDETDNIIAADAERALTEITTNDSGKFTINGLDAGTYWLVETKAKDGYNKLAAPVKVSISFENGKVIVKKDNIETEVVNIENGSGSEMPETGGIGTTIFYVLGSILLVGAAILLITKRRMSAEK